MHWEWRTSGLTIGSSVLTSEISCTCRRLGLMNWTMRRPHRHWTNPIWRCHQLESVRSTLLTSYWVQALHQTQLRSKLWGSTWPQKCPRTNFFIRHSTSSSHTSALAQSYASWQLSTHRSIVWKIARFGTRKQFISLRISFPTTVPLSSTLRRVTQSIT